MKNYYEILEVSHSVTQEKLDLIYVDLIQQQIISTQNNKTDLSLFSLKVEAVLLLKDAAVRRKFDLLLKHKNNTEVRHSLKYRTFLTSFEGSQKLAEKKANLTTSKTKEELALMYKEITEKH